MRDKIEEIVWDSGGIVSSELAAVLVEELGLSAASARKRVSRHPRLRKLLGLTFPRNARFVYLQEQYGSEEFWSSLTRALLTHTTAYAHALCSLQAREGIVPLAHFGIVCGSPGAQKRHLSPNAILSRLEKARLTDRFELPGIGSCVALAQRDGHVHQGPALRARLLAEQILLGALRTWAKNLGLVSFNKVAVRDEAATQPRVGTFSWDLTAPSYLSPLRTWTQDKVKPGFLTCDLLLTPQVSDRDLRPFLSKCHTLAHLPRVGRTLHVFVAQQYSLEALRLAKEAGVVPATVDTLFGKAVAAGLNNLIDIVTDAAHGAADPATIGKVFESLSTIEGAATNLRGALFQYLAAELVRQTIASPEGMNRIFTLPGTEHRPERKAEADIVAIKPHRDVWFVECKGYKPSGMLPDEHVDHWLDSTIQILREYALVHPDWKKLRLNFAFWTTSRLSEYATNRLQLVSSKTKKYSVSFRDGAGIAALSDEVRDSALKRTLREHFLDHPLARIEREVTKSRSRGSNRKQTVRAPAARDETLEFSHLREDVSGDGADGDLPF